MKNFFKENYKFILFMCLFGLVGGYFSGKYLIESYTDDVLNQVIKQLGSKNMLIVVAMIQSLFYSFILGSIGIYLSKRIGLWKKISYDKHSFKISILFGIIGGLLLILPDVFIFNNLSTKISDIYMNKPSINFILSGITYGGIVEEILMRLFLMSFVSFIIYKIFYRKSKINDNVYIISNIIVSLLFALGHLPNTLMTIGLNFIIIFRCILLNGIVGLIFGYVYRKYGVIYSMISHVLVHIVSKIIWIIFI